MATPKRATKRAQLGIAQLGTTRLGSSIPQTNSGGGTKSTPVANPTTTYTRVAA